MLTEKDAKEYKYSKSTKQRVHKWKDIKVKECLKNYYSSIKQGILNIQVIDNLINMSATQLSSIIFNVYDYTSKLTEANNVKIKLTDVKQKTNNIIDLKEYLEVQKDIIRAA